jgi:hypothetical protein
MWAAGWLATIWCPTEGLRNCRKMLEERCLVMKLHGKERIREFVLGQYLEEEQQQSTLPCVESVCHPIPANSMPICPRPWFTQIEEGTTELGRWQPTPTVTHLLHPGHTYSNKATSPNDASPWPKNIQTITSFIPIILRFGLLVVSWISWICWVRIFFAFS